MVNFLLDTSVVVDVMRLHPPAKNWLSTQIDPGIPAIVWLEILQGVQDRTALLKALRTLNDFERIELTNDDVTWSIEQLVRYKLSHNVGGMDCLIASASHRLQIPLYTTNLKHFSHLLGHLAQKPY